MSWHVLSSGLCPPRRSQATDQQNMPTMISFVMNCGLKLIPLYCFLTCSSDNAVCPRSRSCWSSSCRFWSSLFSSAQAQAGATSHLSIWHTVLRHRWNPATTAPCRCVFDAFISSSLVCSYNSGQVSAHVVCTEGTLYAGLTSLCSSALDFSRVWRSSLSCRREVTSSSSSARRCDQRGNDQH